MQLTVAAVQFDIAWEDKPANHATIEAMLDAAGIEAGTLVIVPELGDTGFSFNLDKIVDDQTLPWARDCAARRRIWLQTGFARRADDGKGRNCAMLVDPQGQIAAEYEKVHPFSFGREAEYFSGGSHLAVAAVDGAAVSPLICYDLRFPELWRHAALAGAELFACGASWPAARQQHWRSLLIARAIENQAAVIGVNRVGDDPHLSYAGGSIIIDHMGEVLAEADDTPQTLTATIDLDALRTWRTTFPAIEDIRRSMLGEIPVVSRIRK